MTQQSMNNTKNAVHRENNNKLMFNANNSFLKLYVT